MTKTCEWCGEEYARKPGYSQDAWQRRRFCGMDCLRAWQRGPHATERSGAWPYGFCPSCGRAFKANRSQVFCRDRECQAHRLARRLGMEAIREAALRDKEIQRLVPVPVISRPADELERLIEAQTREMARGPQLERRPVALVSIDAEIAPGLPGWHDMLAAGDDPLTVAKLSPHKRRK